MTESHWLTPRDNFIHQVGERNGKLPSQRPDRCHRQSRIPGRRSLRQPDLSQQSAPVPREKPRGQRVYCLKLGAFRIFFELFAIPNMKIISSHFLTSLRTTKSLSPPLVPSPESVFRGVRLGTRSVRQSYRGRCSKGWIWRTNCWMRTITS